MRRAAESGFPINGNPAGDVDEYQDNVADRRKAA